MSAELSDWLAELCAAGPGSAEWLTATETGAAIAAVMSATDPGDLALVTDLAASAVIGSPDDQLVEVDYAYQQLLEGLQLLRHQVAEAASFRHMTRGRLTMAGHFPLPFTADEIAAFAERERTLTERSQRNQAAVDRFRITKETAKARYIAARATREILLALLDPGAGPAMTSDELEQARAELPEAEANLAAASEQIAAALAWAARLSRTLAREPRSGESGQPAATAAEPAGAGDDRATAGLFELRADPLGTDVRILLAVEPADTVTLLAVLDGSAAVSEHRELAIKLAGELLTELRTTGWSQGADGADGAGDSDSAELAFADDGAFLATYFPGSAARVKRRSAALATASALQLLRQEQQLSLADLAGRTRRAASELRRLETGDLADAHVADLAAYVRALGGRLRVTAEFDGQQQGLI
jgi:hypothetical protein